MPKSFRNITGFGSYISSIKKESSKTSQKKISSVWELQVKKETGDETAGYQITDDNGNFNVMLNMKTFDTAGSLEEAKNKVNESMKKMFFKPTNEWKQVEGSIKKEESKKKGGQKSYNQLKKKAQPNEFTSFELQEKEKEEVTKKRTQEQKDLPDPSTIEILGCDKSDNNISPEEYKKINANKIYVDNLSEWWNLAKKTGQEYYDEIAFSPGYLILIDSGTAYYWEIDYPGLSLESSKKLSYNRIKKSRMEKFAPKQPPKEWWDKMYKKIKKGNPKYDDEKIRETVGNIWYNDLSDSKRKEILQREKGKKKTKKSIKKTGMWKDKLQNVYDSFEEFKKYDDTYGLTGRLGYDSPEEAWEDNPLIQGSTDPADFKVVKEESKKMSYKQLKKTAEMSTDEVKELEEKTIKSLEDKISKIKSTLQKGNIITVQKQLISLSDIAKDAANKIREEGSIGVKA